MRRRALFLSALIVLLATAVAVAMTPFGRRSVDRAQSDAASELVSVVVPPGAMKVRSDPSVHHKLGPQAVACSKQYVAEDHRFWRVPGSPAAVWKWLQNNPPRRSRLLGSGMLKKGKKPLAWDVEFAFQDQRNVTGRVDYMALRPATGGGTALRVDAVAVGEPRAHHPPCFSAGG